MKKILILLLALILSLSLFCSCNKDDEGNATDAETNGSQNATEETVDGLLLSGEKRYRVVYPHGDSALKAISLKIYDKHHALAPTALTKPAYYSLTSDNTDAAGAKEILVGLTNRPATEKAADNLKNYPDFTITLQDGNIVILANTQARLEAAVRYFIKNMKASASGDVYYTGDTNYVDVYKGDYAAATVNGKPLKDYSIVLSADATDAEKALATELSNELSFITGTTLPTTTDSSAALKIVFGKGEEGSLNDRIYLDGDALVLEPATENGYRRLIETLASKIRACRGIITNDKIEFSSLSYDAIRSVSFGAVNITEQENGLRFNKFSDFQIEEWTKHGRYNQASSSTGIRLDFYTNSSTFYFAASQNTNFELFINGESKEISSTGKFDVTLEGEQNRITVLFPNHQVNSTVGEVRIDEGATLIPYTYARKFLIIGDSITQGYSAATDSLSWANRITRMFDADSVIQAISGGCYQPNTLDPEVDFTPDYILVAYGTNDWSWGRASMDDFKAYAQSFYEKLAELYPEATIIGITPIWRKDNDPSKVGTFDDMRAELAKIIESVGGHAIDGIDLVPHERAYYGDDNCLHPNNDGFEHYANNLYEKIKDIIK